MPRKRKKNRARPKRPLAPAKFSVGTQVRAKRGITVPDFEDIPLGGWAGAITEVDQRSNPPLYEIKWNQHTLDHMHPVFVKRSERDGIELDSLWLAEDDIEPDTGDPVPIEQPTQIITRPLRMNDQDDRIRAILGLTSDDPVPNVDEDKLRKYHRHLAEKLTFPFQGSYEQETGPFQSKRHQITVTALLDPDEGDEDEGLLGEVVEDGDLTEFPLAEIEAASGPNRQLIDDYAYWFGNWPAGASVATKFPTPSRPGKNSSAPVSRRFTLVTTFLMGGFYGVVLGAALESLDGALIAIQVGGVLFGLVVALLGTKYGRIFGAVNRIAQGGMLGGVLGAVFGAGLGALLGVMVVAWAGTLAGGLAGGLLGSALREKFGRPATLPSVIGGAMIGVFVQAWLHNADAAWMGTWIGVLIGAVAGPVLYFGAGIALTVLDKEQG